MPPRQRAQQAVVLVDTNVIIEAVRTNCWNALTGEFAVETVEECRDEALRGDATGAGYIAVAQDDLDRLASVHAVSKVSQARFAMAYAAAPSMDDGERDLFAHTLGRAEDGDSNWALCSPDKASIKAGVSLGWGEKLRSLEALCKAVGARPSPPLAGNYEERWLSAIRLQFLLSP